MRLCCLGTWRLYHDQFWESLSVEFLEVFGQLQSHFSDWKPRSKSISWLQPYRLSMAMWFTKLNVRHITAGGLCEQSLTLIRIVKCFTKNAEHLLRPAKYPSHRRMFSTRLVIIVFSNRQFPLNMPESAKAVTETSRMIIWVIQRRSSTIRNFV